MAVESTTFTTIVMILFAVFVLTLSGYTWFGSWEPRRLTREERLELEFQQGVREMRQAIREYERGS
jgi:uncharacterized membrane protein